MVVVPFVMTTEVSLNVDVNPASANCPTEIRNRCCMEGKMWVVRAASGMSWKGRRLVWVECMLAPLGCPTTTAAVVGWIFSHGKSAPK